MAGPIRPIPFNVLEPGSLRDVLLVLKQEVEKQGDAVADTTDVSDTATQLNALLAELRSTGIIKT
jgi:hypothetical protein